MSGPRDQDDGQSPAGRLAWCDLDLMEALLVHHARWPTPPEAWSRLFTACAIVRDKRGVARHAETMFPADIPRLAVASHLLAHILERIASSEDDLRPYRAFHALVRTRGQLFPRAIAHLSNTRAKPGPARDAFTAAAGLLDQLNRDAAGEMVRGLTAGTGGATQRSTTTRRPRRTSETPRPCARRSRRRPTRGARPSAPRRVAGPRATSSPRCPFCSISRKRGGFCGQENRSRTMFCADPSPWRSSWIFLRGSRHQRKE